MGKEAMETFLKLLEEQFPLLITVALVLFICSFALRVYRTMQADLERNIEKAVDGKLGRVLVEIQEKHAEFTAMMPEVSLKVMHAEAELENARKKMMKNASEFSTQTGIEREQKNLLLEDAPDVEALSAREIYLEAQQHDEPRTKAALCQKVLEHKDSSSRDLEYAGDLMRTANRNTLAQALYEKAHQKDPDNRSAHLELLALRIELDHTARRPSLEAARRLIAENPKPRMIARLADALIEVDFYEELLALSEGIERMQPGKDALQMALRNKAVALTNLRRDDESIEAYRAAFALSPEDQNTLIPYLQVLEQQGDDEQHMEIVHRLLDSDPSRVRYYVIYVRKLIQLRRWEEARAALQRAAQLPVDADDAARLNHMRLQVEAALAFADQPPDRPEAAHGGPGPNGASGGPPGAAQPDGPDLS